MPTGFSHRREVIDRVIELKLEGYNTSKIAALVTVDGPALSKNAVIGILRRHAHELTGAPTAKEPTTLFQRLDAMHAKLDAVLRECGVRRAPAGP